MIKVENEKDCVITGNVAELLAETALVVEGITNALSSELNKPKGETLEFVITAVYKAVKDSLEETKA